MGAYGLPRPGYPPIRPHFRRPGGFDPFTLLALQNSGSDDNLLPLLLLGGGGLGGHPGRGGLGGHGAGGINPLQLLAFQKGGLGGGSGGNDNLLPLLLLGGGGLGGHPGKGGLGGLNPLLLSGLLGCK